MNRKICWLSMGCLLLLLNGCNSVENMQKMNTNSLHQEGSLVFVRPGHYSILGTKSMRDYVDVVYEKMTTNDRGFAHVAVGIRNVGGRHWYDKKGPTVQIGAEIAFYKTSGVDSEPVYRSNRRSVVIQRGETTHITFDCPVPGAVSYQIVFSDY